MPCGHAIFRESFPQPQTFSCSMSSIIVKAIGIYPVAQNSKLGSIPDIFLVFSLTCKESESPIPVNTIIFSIPVATTSVW